MRGRFISFEGIDGSGKSTQLRATADALNELGIATVQTREPGGTEVGELLRSLLLKRPMSPLTETLLMFAARIEHIDEVIVPAVSSGKWVLCDRFTDATYAYQCGGRGISSEWIASLASWVHPTLQPDLTVLIDLDPVTAAVRRATDRKTDRFEAEQTAFFERVRATYLERAQREPHRFLVLDGRMPTERSVPLVLERLAAWHG
jgi:dTMP kinase